MLMHCSRRTRRRLGVWSVVCALALVAACAYNPMIGRSQLLLAPEAQMAELGQASWEEIKRTEQVSRDRAANERAERVGARVVSALGEDPGRWEFAVFENDQLNAFALPGGKVGVNSGMLDFCRTDAELAAVIGHEIAHVRLQHANERVSQDLALRTAAELLSPDMSQEAATLLGAGVTFGLVLPFSRRQELEADRLGVRYLAQADYDPQAAVDFWTRMGERAAGSSPAWASTHPSDAERLAALRSEVAQLKASGS